MTKLKQYSKEFSTFLLSLLVISGLYLTSLYSYLLFHTIVELITIVIGSGIFVIAWNTRQLSENNYHLFLGIAFLFISILDFTHTLAYSGMNIFQGYDSNLPTQLWIAARFMQSLSLLLAFPFLRRKLNEFVIFPVYFLITSILVISIFLNFFPVCYLEGAGLTLFKIISEYIISLILLAGIGVLLKNRNEFKPQVFKWLLISFVLSIISEISFTFYISVYGLSNLIGHMAKLIAFYMIYKAIIERGMMRPFDSIFNNLAESEERFQALVDTASDAIIIINAEGNINFWNKAAESIFGFSSPEMLGKPSAQIMPYEIQKAFTDGIKRVTQTENTRIFGKIMEIDGITKIGSKVPLALSMSTWKAKGEVFYTVIIRDISERKELEEKIRLDSQMLSNIIDGVLLYKASDGKIIYSNPQIENIFGYLPGELIGKQISILNSSRDTNPEEKAQEIIEMVKKTGSWEGEIHNTTKDGRDFWSQASISSFMHKEYGEVFVTTQQDFTKRKTAQLKLKHESTHDSLTGLYNRTFFDEELKRLQLGRRFPVSVIMADIDGLKIMNDKYGHDKGDLLLQRAAKVLARSFRGDDMISRLGGDEFAALLPNTDAEAAKQTLLRIENNIIESNTATDEIPLSISLGASTAENSRELRDSLVQADKNLYRAKNKIINR